MSRPERPIVASVEDADDLGNVVEGVEPRYASSVAPSCYAKEQPNTGRARRDKNRRGSSSPLTTSALTDSDSTVHPRRDALKKSSKDREKPVSSSKKALMAAARPPVKHAKTTPSLPRRDAEAAYYGVDPAMTPATSRPRAQTSRPASYYGPPPPSRPPPANSRFYMTQTPSPSIPIPTPSWGHGPPGGPMPPFGPPPSSSPLVMHHHPSGPPPDYFPVPHSRPLEHRFGPSARPQSAMGFTPPRAAIEFDEYDEPPMDRSLARRPSTTRRVSKIEEDRRAMPPPPRRPASARPTALAFRPPPSTPAPMRRPVGYDDRDSEYDDGLFGDLSPLAPAPSNHEFSSPIPFRPRQPFGAEQGYDAPEYQTEIAGPRGYRRNSYYGGGHSGSFTSSAFEDSLRQAVRYQEEATGGPPLPLTADSLRKASRNGGSSRSTRSSGSHDESDYRQSATTRTTRSSAPNDENFTIRVKGSTVLKFGGAEMQCQDGAEININSRTGAPEIRNVGSDRSSYIDHEDRRTRIGHDDRRPRIDHDDRGTRVDLDDRQTRVDIPMSRNRAKSRARSKSYGRAYSTYDTTPDYEYGFAPPPLPPPYPAYPSSYSSRQDDGYFGPPM